MSRAARARIRPPLTIAGSDPTGGAGLEADLKVFLRHGLSGVAVTTALTVQDTHGVREIGAVPRARFRRRLEALLDDVRIGGLKTGLLPGKAHVLEVAAAVRAAETVPFVLDPVLAPSSGPPFLDAGGRRALLEHLLPLCELVTPNVEEAATLLGTTGAAVRRHPDRILRSLHDAGANAVLLKGGHARGATAVDWLFDGRVVRELERPRLRGGPFHGTGCALSAAILSERLRGRSLPTATRRAKDFVHDAIARAERIGGGASRLCLTPR